MSRIHLAESDRQHLGLGNAAVNRTGRRLRIMTSSVMEGVFRDRPETRSEFMSIAKR